MKARRSKLAKLLAIAKSPFTHRAELKAGINRIYNDILVRQSPIPSVDAAEYLGDVEITMRNFFPRDGNVAIDELIFLAALCRKLAPQVVVEIGTFDGNSTLQLALNAPSSAVVDTLDLPVDVSGTTSNDPEDHKYIASSHRVARRFLGTSAAEKVHQHYGDSLRYDFTKFAECGRPALIFIDAGHSYACVKNDTEKSLSILAEGGTIVWQDYGSVWPDVYEYLVELSSTHDLVHIHGTSLVVFTAPT